jgi:threonyl-tRNA synthetase
MPERFDLAYVGADGAPHRPVMVHRAVLSTAERLVGHLLERHQGAWPYWLAPVQVALLPVTEGEASAAEELAAALRRAGQRVEVAAPDETLGARIRSATAARVPVIGVLGPREVEAGTVAVRLRGSRRSDDVARNRLVKACVEAGRRRAAQLSL